jgi:hypothetical protein
MLFRDRIDGKRCSDIADFKAIMPYIMRSRNESAVFFSRDLDVENAIRYVKARNTACDENRYSLFGLVLAAGVRTFALKPRLNRFVHRRGIYEHSKLSFSFIVKKRLTEESAETNAKIYFDPADTLDTVMDRFNAAVEKARGEELGPDDREVLAAHQVPGGKALASGGFRFLDRFNIAPAGMIDNDPLFTSAYFANLGSIGLETPYHHLYEWGSASLFVVLGRMFQKEATRSGGPSSLRHFINMKVTVDERIADGIYFAHSAALFSRLLLHPEILETPPDLSQAEG